jgi:hypothetical protein
MFSPFLATLVPSSGNLGKSVKTKREFEESEINQLRFDEFFIQKMVNY